MSNPKISIIILNWNGEKYIKECLESVLKTEYPNFEVIVVDNASTDRSKEIIKRYPQVKLIENKKNLGFCEGNNIGIRCAIGDIIILLNNDTTVDRNWIKEILKKFEEPKVGIVGCRLYFPRRNIIQSLGWKIKFLGYWESIGAGYSDREQFNYVDEVDYVSGSALAIKREVLNKVGLLDPYFYAYCEDIDLCYRARRAGYKVVTSNAIVYHHESISWNYFPIKKIYLSYRNKLYFIKKHYGIRALLKYFLEYPVKFTRINVYRYLSGYTILQRMFSNDVKLHRNIIGIAIRTFLLKFIMFYTTFLFALYQYLSYKIKISFNIFNTIKNLRNS
jgi:GT2 family glycosyltransferase